MKTLYIDGVKACIHSTKPVPNCGGWVRVVVGDGKPSSQHDIPGTGKFRVNGHRYEWREE